MRCEKDGVGRARCVKARPRTAFSRTATPLKYPQIACCEALCHLTEHCIVYLCSVTRAPFGTLFLLGKERRGPRGNEIIMLLEPVTAVGRTCSVKKVRHTRSCVQVLETSYSRHTAEVPIL